MKGTEHFKQTVKAYLDGRAQTDELFAVSYAKENKNLDDCITFILNQVKASGCCGMTDDEVWSLAVHYYDEDNIDVGKPISCGVVVNHKVELTEEENTGYVIGSQVGQWYVTVVSRSGSGIYIETTRNISSIYENRDAMYARYQIGVILLTVLVGCVILFMLFFVMRNSNTG